jgi:hypothetical protein
VDEAGVRTLLHRLAETEPPPVRIDLGAAIAAGRRGRFWRRVRAGGSALLAAGAAAAAVAAILAGPAPRPGHQATDTTVAPARFDVLVPYATFGWLPPGFQTGAETGATPVSRPTLLTLIAVSHGTGISVLVNPAGSCDFTGRALRCSTSGSTEAVASRAPDVNGHRAYWLRGDQLAWEYAPGAWSALNWTDVPWPPGGAQRAAVLRVAAGVRFGQITPIRFPYWMSGLPTAWRISEVDYTLRAGQPVVWTLRLADGPGYADADRLLIYTVPYGFPCSPGGQHVTIDRVAAVVLSAPAQQVCIPQWNGLRMQVILLARQNAPPPNPTGAHGVLAYARMLHLPGPGPAHWTTNPLR